VYIRGAGVLYLRLLNVGPPIPEPQQQFALDPDLVELQFGLHSTGMVYSVSTQVWAAVAEPVAGDVLAQGCRLLQTRCIANPSFPIVVLYNLNLGSLSSFALPSLLMHLSGAASKPSAHFQRQLCI
jgi:hypothetical protein